MDLNSGKLRVLVANEPRIYREVVADALSKLRPLLEVLVIEPQDVDREVGRFGPHLVICSRATEAVREGCLAWVVLYPDGEDRVEVGGRGEISATRPLAGVGVAGLLSMVDETGLLRGAAR